MAITSTRSPVSSSIDATIDAFIENPSGIFTGRYKNILSVTYVESVASMSRMESSRIPPLQRFMSPVISTALALQAGIEKENCGFYVKQLEDNLEQAFMGIASNEQILKLLSITHDITFMLKSIEAPYKHSAKKSVVEYIEKRSSEMTPSEMKTYSLHMEVLAWAFERDDHPEMAKALREFSAGTQNFEPALRDAISHALTPAFAGHPTMTVRSRTLSS